MNNTREKVRAFVATHFLFGQAGDLTDSTSFLDRGIIDSTGVLEMVAFLEQTFALKVPTDDLVPDNLDSIDLICAYLERTAPVQVASPPVMR